MQARDLTHTSSLLVADTLLGSLVRAGLLYGRTAWHAPAHKARAGNSGERLIKTPVIAYSPPCM